MMKAEAVAKRITMIQASLSNMRSTEAELLKTVSERIAANVSDPEYIQRWLENWMEPIRMIRAEQKDLLAQLSILDWVSAE